MPVPVPVGLRCAVRGYHTHVKGGCGEGEGSSAAPTCCRCSPASGGGAAGTGDQHCGSPGRRERGAAGPTAAGAARSGRGLRPGPAARGAVAAPPEP